MAEDGETNVSIKEMGLANKKATRENIPSQTIQLYESEKCSSTAALHL